MPEALKNVYSVAFFESLFPVLKEYIQGFDSKNFLAMVMDKNWKNLELKQRMKHIALVLEKFLPGNFATKLDKLVEITRAFGKGKTAAQGFAYMFIPEFIEAFGIDDPSRSLKAMKEITKFTSCEFAIRPFLKLYPDKVLSEMQKWSKDKDSQVRRLSSEGCRPRLPWAMAIPSLKKDPSPIFPILENLVDDPSETVRRSVANNLNDISRDHPKKVIEFVKKWQDKGTQINWILKHASRTLLRKADPEILTIFKLNPSSEVLVKRLNIHSKNLRIGDRLEFSFQLANQHPEKTRLRVEYAIYYVKANGKHNRKLFRITENEYESLVPYSFKRGQSFKDMTTRKHYPGLHKIAIVVNGKELATNEFDLGKMKQ